MFYHLITSFTLPPLMDTLYIHIEHFAEKYKYLVAVYICKLILQFSTNINRLKFKLINFMYISDFKVLEFYLKVWFNISTSKWEMLYLWSLEIILSNYIWNIRENVTLLMKHLNRNILNVVIPIFCSCRYIFNMHSKCI